jgi:hypothetical protein
VKESTIADCQPSGSDNCQYILSNDNEDYDAQKSDERDSDADTIRMSSFEFWNGVNAEDVPVIPQILILTECYGQSKEKSQTVHSTKKLDLEREEKKKNYRSVS